MPNLRPVKPSAEDNIKIDNDEWYRAGGECVCGCGKYYKDHICIEVNESFHLNRLCNGDLVKL